jgi:hypothetical protein
MCEASSSMISNQWDERSMQSIFHPLELEIFELASLPELASAKSGYDISMFICQGPLYI